MELARHLSNLLTSGSMSAAVISTSTSRRGALRSDPSVMLRLLHLLHTLILETDAPLAPYVDVLVRVLLVFLLEPSEEELTREMASTSPTAQSDSAETAADDTDMSRAQPSALIAIASECLRALAARLSSVHEIGRLVRQLIAEYRVFESEVAELRISTGGQGAAHADDESSVRDSGPASGGSVGAVWIAPGDERLSLSHDSDSELETDSSASPRGRLGSSGHAESSRPRSRGSSIVITPSDVVSTPVRQPSWRGPARSGSGSGIAGVAAAVGAAGDPRRQSLASSSFRSLLDSLAPTGDTPAATIGPPVAAAPPLPPRPPTSRAPPSSSVASAPIAMSRDGGSTHSRGDSDRMLTSLPAAWIRRPDPAAVALSIGRRRVVAALSILVDLVVSRLVALEDRDADLAALRNRPSTIAAASSLAERSPDAHTGGATTDGMLARVADAEDGVVSQPIDPLLSLVRADNEVVGSLLLALSDESLIVREGSLSLWNGLLEPRSRRDGRLIHAWGGMTSLVAIQAVPTALPRAASIEFGRAIAIADSEGLAAAGAPQEAPATAPEASTLLEPAASAPAELGSPAATFITPSEVARYASTVVPMSSMAGAPPTDEVLPFALPHAVPTDPLALPVAALMLSTQHLAAASPSVERVVASALPASTRFLAARTDMPLPSIAFSYLSRSRPLLGTGPTLGLSFLQIRAILCGLARSCELSARDAEIGGLAAASAARQAVLVWRCVLAILTRSGAAVALLVVALALELQSTAQRHARRLAQVRGHTRIRSDSHADHRTMLIASSAGAILLQQTALGLLRAVGRFLRSQDLVQHATVAEQVLSTMAGLTGLPMVLSEVSWQLIVAMDTTGSLPIASAIASSSCIASAAICAELVTRSTPMLAAAQVVARRPRHWRELFPVRRYDAFVRAEADVHTLIDRIDSMDGDAARNALDIDTAIVPTPAALLTASPPGAARLAPTMSLPAIIDPSGDQPDLAPVDSTDAPAGEAAEVAVDPRTESVARILRAMILVPLWPRVATDVPHEHAEEQVVDAAPADAGPDVTLVDDLPSETIRRATLAEVLDLLVAEGGSTDGMVGADEASALRGLASGAAGSGVHRVGGVTSGDGGMRSSTSAVADAARTGTSVPSDGPEPDISSSRAAAAARSIADGAGAVLDMLDSLFGAGAAGSPAEDADALLDSLLEDTVRADQAAIDGAGFESEPASRLRFDGGFVAGLARVEGGGESFGTRELAYVEKVLPQRRGESRDARFGLAPVRTHHFLRVAADTPTLASLTD